MSPNGDTLGWDYAPAGFTEGEMVEMVRCAIQGHIDAIGYEATTPLALARIAVRTLRDAGPESDD
ncbi:MAG TPA: hypothetical protein VG815_14985 [Chloroflexota bacterium]|nr:hypothetical protein [Chloroflexota bacterium]HEV3370483.1 hypothetical protein [Acidimicrobiales bacterium]